MKCNRIFTRYWNKHFKEQDFPLKPGVAKDGHEFDLLENGIYIMRENMWEGASSISFLTCFDKNYKPEGDMVAREANANRVDVLGKLDETFVSSIHLLLGIFLSFNAKFPDRILNAVLVGEEEWDLTKMILWVSHDGMRPWSDGHGDGPEQAYLCIDSNDIDALIHGKVNF